MRSSFAAVAAVTLDMFRTGTVCLSAAGGVLYSNQEMETLLAKRDGLYLVNGILSFWDRAAGQAMGVAVKDALAKRSSAIAAERPSGEPDFRINVMPLPAHAAALQLDQAAAIAFVAEARVPTEASIAAASRIYGLTPREAGVMRQLVQGLDTRRIAAHCGNSIHTVRCQVKTILAKTSVKRQADLILLVTTLPQVG